MCVLFVFGFVFGERGSLRGSNDDELVEISRVWALFLLVLMLAFMMQ